MGRALIAVLLVAVVACGEADEGTSATTAAAAPAGSTGVSSAPSSGPTEPTGVLPTAEPTSSPAAPSAFPACDDVPAIEAPADWYRDRPVYVGNEQPVEQVQAWARGRPGYQEIWLDRDHFGWITVAFTADATARQAELEAELPGVGVVAVEVPTTLTDLTALQERAHELLADAGVEFAGSGTYVDRWVVGLDVNIADERIATALAPLVGQRICLSDTGIPTPEGPQPDRGDGWRLLGDELVGDSYRTGIATDDGQYRELWRQVGLTGERPPVDFGAEVVVWFGAVYGSSCPIRLDDVVVDRRSEIALVHAVTVVPGGIGVCTDDANPHAYVVAVARDRLPAGPFAIQLGPDDPPAGVPEERTVVDADLSVPGATATADQIRPDQALIDASQRPQPVDSGGFIESGRLWPYRLYVHCGVAVLGQLNGVWWMTGTGDDPVPPEWATLVDPDTQTIVVDVIINGGPDPTVTATASGYSVDYGPVAADTVPGCD